MASVRLRNALQDRVVTLWEALRIADNTDLPAAEFAYRRKRSVTVSLNAADVNKFVRVF